MYLFCFLWNTAHRCVFPVSFPVEIKAVINPPERKLEDAPLCTVLEKWDHTYIGVVIEILEKLIWYNWNSSRILIHTRLSWHSLVRFNTTKFKSGPRSFLIWSLCERLNTAWAIAHFPPNRLCCFPMSNAISCNIGRIFSFISSDKPFPFWIAW